MAQAYHKMFCGRSQFRGRKGDPKVVSVLMPFSHLEYVEEIINLKMIVVRTKNQGVISIVIDK